MGIKSSLPGAVECCLPMMINWQSEPSTLQQRQKFLTNMSFLHDEVGFNYRLPSLNAALGVAQMEQLHWMLEMKERIAGQYCEFLIQSAGKRCIPSKTSKATIGLMQLFLEIKKERNAFLEYTNEKNIMTRPIWRLMSELEMFKNCQNDGLKNSKWLEERIVNLPSSVPNGFNQLANE